MAKVGVLFGIHGSPRHYDIEVVGAEEVCVQERFVYISYLKVPVVSLTLESRENEL